LLDLKAGINEVLTTSVSSQLEPDSVVLRDPSGRNPVNILEQNYDAGVVTQQWLLEKYEGKTLDFQVRPALHRYAAKRRDSRGLRTDRPGTHHPRWHKSTRRVQRTHAVPASGNSCLSRQQ
jgi:hypothetical protein